MTVIVTQASPPYRSPAGERTCWLTEHHTRENKTMATQEKTLPRPDGSGEYPAFAFPGGYHILYRTADGGLLCATCVNSDEARQTDEDYPDDDQWRVVGAFVNWEGPPVCCDHCGDEICSEYGDPDNDDDAP